MIRPYFKLAVVMMITGVASYLLITILLRPAAIRRDMDRIQQGRWTEQDARRLFGSDYPWQIRNASVPAATQPTTAPSR